MVFPVRRVRGLIALGAIALSSLSLVSCVSSQGTHESALQVPATQPLGKRIGSSKPAAIDPATLARRPPPIEAYLGKISPAVFNQLKYLPLMAPAHIPEDFLLNKHDVTASGYFLIYRSQSDQCFAIEYASSGSGPSEQVADNSADSSNGPSSEQGAFLDEEAESTSERKPESSPAELTEDEVAGPNKLPSLHLVPQSQELVFFDSPVFGDSQKIFYGNAAQEIAAHESAIATKAIATEKVSDDNGVDGVQSQTLQARSPQTEASATTEPAQQKAPFIALASGQTTKASLVSQWLTNSNGHYRYLSGAIIPQNYPAQTPCVDVSLEQSVKIITSLADLTAEPTDSIGEVIAPPQNSDLSDAKPEN